MIKLLNYVRNGLRIRVLLCPGQAPNIPSFIHHTHDYRCILYGLHFSLSYSLFYFTLPLSIYYIFTVIRTNYSQPLLLHTTESKSHLYLLLLSITYSSACSHILLSTLGPLCSGIQPLLLHTTEIIFYYLL